MQYQSVYQLLNAVVAANANKLAYQFKREGQWQNVTWSEQAARCRQIAKSLLALDVAKGDRVAILSATRLEWVQCDFGIMSAGAVTVGVYPTNLAADCAYVINHCDAEIVFVENKMQLDKLLSMRQEIGRVRHIVIYDGASDTQNGVMSWQEFLSKGEAIADSALEQRAAMIQADDLASLVYTSGTTGVPKGVMLTHRNVLFTMETASASLYLRPDFVTLLFLPMAHVFARLIINFSMYNGMAVAFAEGIEKVPDNLKEIQPHFIASVPRIFEKIYTKVTSSVQDAGGAKAKLFHWALNVGYQVSALQQKKQSIPAGLKLKHRLAHKLVLSKVQAAFGGRMLWAVSGAAPLNKSIAEFFHACGVLILEGIGMTENTSFTNVNRYDNNKFGTVGQAGPGVEMKLANDGEVLYRGANVMKGYFKSPEATAETIDKDGWLYTGDIGEIDSEGFLRITDRKKDLIITAGGKNIAPQRIERILRTSRYISQAMAFGDRKKYVTALVTLNPEHVVPWAKTLGIAYKSFEELARHPKVRELINAEVAEKNKELASFESVKQVRIVPRDFSVDGGELTASLKIKRKVVTERYHGLLEEMYEPAD
ncbi:MAG: long-chain fatty acid--CoA ligase [candidate division KSB1 bacterium]